MLLQFSGRGNDRALLVYGLFIYRGKQRKKAKAAHLESRIHYDINFFQAW